MNICIVTEYFPHSENLEIKGGVEVCAFNEAQQLSKYNNITVLTSNDENNTDDFYIDNIHVICCGNKRKIIYGTVGKENDGGFLPGTGFQIYTGTVYFTNSI